MAVKFDRSINLKRLYRLCLYPREKQNKNKNILEIENIIENKNMM